MADPRTNSKCIESNPVSQHVTRVEAESQVAARIQKDFQPILLSGPDRVPDSNMATRFCHLPFGSRKKPGDVPQCN